MEYFLSNQMTSCSRKIHAWLVTSTALLNIHTQGSPHERYSIWIDKIYISTFWKYPRIQEIHVLINKPKSLFINITHCSHQRMEFHCKGGFLRFPQRIRLLQTPVVGYHRSEHVSASLHHKSLSMRQTLPTVTSCHELQTLNEFNSKKHLFLFFCCCCCCCCCLHANLLIFLLHYSVWTFIWQQMITAFILGRRAAPVVSVKSIYRNTETTASITTSPPPPPPFFFTVRWDASPSQGALCIFKGFLDVSWV